MITLKMETHQTILTKDNPDKKEIVGVYDRAAGVYEQVGIKAATYFGTQLVDKLMIQSGERILDVGTGRGALLFPAARKAGHRGYVVGIDLAPNMVRSTGADVRRRNLTQVGLCIMDADEMAFPARCFDTILCGFTLHFLDYPQVLPRLRRMLKRGGQIAMANSYIPTQDSQNMERWSWLFELTRQVYPPDFTPPAFWTAPNRLNRPEIIEAVLHETGFDDIYIASEEKVMYFIDEDDWWAWEWSQASRFWLEGMSPDGLTKFKAAAYEKLDSIKEPEGIPIKWGALYVIARV